LSFFATERQLEDYIFDRFKERKVLDVNGDQFENVYRQLNIKGVGIPDLIFTSRGCSEALVKPCIYVVELKNKPIEDKDAAQLSRYTSYFERHLDNVDVMGLLVGPSIKSKDISFFSPVVSGCMEIYVFNRVGDKVEFEYFMPEQAFNDSAAEALDVFSEIKTDIGERPKLKIVK